MDFDQIFYYFFYFMTIIIGLYSLVAIIDLVIQERNDYKQKRMNDERRNNKNNE
jgi:type III secretory pathway component EscU